MHPILFQFRSLTVYSYGFFIALAMLLNFAVVSRRATMHGLNPQIANDFLLLLFVAGVIGARFFYLAQHWSDYESNFWQMINIREGGLVWYGGFIVAVLAGIGYGRWKHLQILKWCDFFTPHLALGHAIGRLGCFFNGCCYGHVYSFGVVFSGEQAARIPVQLYESIFLFTLAAFLFLIASKNKVVGRLFFIYLFIYGAGRFALEFLRGDQSLYLGWTIPQWTSLILIGIAVVSIKVFQKK